MGKELTNSRAAMSIPQVLCSPFYFYLQHRYISLCCKCYLTTSESSIDKQFYVEGTMQDAFLIGRAFEEFKNTDAIEVKATAQGGYAFEAKNMEEPKEKIAEYAFHLRKETALLLDRFVMFEHSNSCYIKIVVSSEVADLKFYRLSGTSDNVNIFIARFLSFLNDNLPSIIPIVPRETKNNKEVEEVLKAVKRLDKTSSIAIIQCILNLLTLSE